MGPHEVYLSEPARRLQPSLPDGHQDFDPVELDAINDRLDTVTVIKAKAFAKKAKKAKKIVIPATIKRVNKKGFTGTKKLKTIIVKGTKSFTVKKGAFKKVNSKKITVKVNKKMKAKEFKKLKKNLKKAGFKGKIKK